MELLNILLLLCSMVGLMSSRTSSYRYGPHGNGHGPGPGPGAPSSSSLDVMEFGAVGDGETDDSQAFVKVWNAACGGASEQNAILEIPADKIFLLNPLMLEGPCTSPSITIMINGKIIAPSKISEWSSETKAWIAFYQVEGLTVTGNGTIDGQGQEWWQACENGNNGCSDRPTALSFHHCENLTLSGLKHYNSQKNHISITRCNGATVSGIHINAPETSPNTDGIDISNSVNVKVQDSVISTGDDCIAIGNNCAHINITGVFCGPGHGISVGSLGYHGEESAVEEIHVYNCTFNGTQNGARIKTWQGGSGYARKISFEKIILIAAENPIIIDQYYDAFLQNQESSSSSASAVEISDVSYTDFKGTSSGKEAIELKCSEKGSCNNIVLDHVHIFAASPSGETDASCINARAKINDTLPHLECSVS